MSYDATVQRYVSRFRDAAHQGKIRRLDEVWSPKDTLNDCRWRYVDNDGRAHVLYHGEANGFLTGLGV